MRTLAATVRASGEGERRWFCGGGLHTWKATAEETGGAFLMFEDILEAGKVTPLHQHPDADETFYLLEGEILLHVDGAERQLGAGGIAILPRSVPHAFKVTSEHARMLCLQTPGGGEAFFRLASDPALRGEPRTALDFDRIRRAAERTGAIEILGPPPF
ncbi:MAG TPA: quercetin 2,3-dioxygenase [Jatrophihabitantaceae bacterium]